MGFFASEVSFLAIKVLRLFDNLGSYTWRSREVYSSPFLSPTQLPLAFLQLLGTSKWKPEEKLTI